MKSKHMLIKVLSILIVFSVLVTACGAPATTEAPACKQKHPRRDRQRPQRRKHPQPPKRLPQKHLAKSSRVLLSTCSPLSVRKSPNRFSAAAQTLRNLPGQPSM